MYCRLWCQINIQLYDDLIEWKGKSLWDYKTLGRLIDRIAEKYSSKPQNRAGRVRRAPKMLSLSYLSLKFACALGFTVSQAPSGCKLRIPLSVAYELQEIIDNRYTYRCLLSLRRTKMDRYVRVV